MRRHLSALVGDAPAVLQRRDERPDGGGAPEGGKTTNVRSSGEILTSAEHKEPSKFDYFC